MYDPPGRSLAELFASSPPAVRYFCFCFCFLFHFCLYSLFRLGCAHDNREEGRSCPIGCVPRVGGTVSPVVLWAARLMGLCPLRFPSSFFSTRTLLPAQPSELLHGLEMKPSVLAASLEKRLLPRAAKMRAAGIEPEFSRDFRSLAQLTDVQFRVSGSCRAKGNKNRHNIYIYIYCESRTCRGGVYYTPGTWYR